MGEEKSRSIPFYVHNTDIPVYSLIQTNILYFIIWRSYAHTKIEGVHFNELTFNVRNDKDEFTRIERNE